jgi:hypothetical protein
MKPSNLVARLLEDHNDGANLTPQELQQIYLKDFNGELGVLKLAYTGKGDDGKSHRYLGLFRNENVDEGNPEAWYVTDIYVNAKEDGLHLDFGGSPTFEAPDRKTAEDWLDKESHMKGGGKIKKPEAQRFPANGDRPYVPPINQRLGKYRRGGGSSDNPHWDGNRYAL